MFLSSFLGLASRSPLRNRRGGHHGLLGMVLPIALTVALLAAHASAQATLKEAAAKAGLNIGVATSGSIVSGTNRAYQDLVKGEFNTLVCENDMKFQSTEPSQGRFTYTGGDRVQTFAAANSMKLRGHTLVWHSQSGWASSLNGSRAEMLKVMKDHIDAVAGHFKGKVLEWDVVNEAVADGSTSLRNSFWRQQIGDDFIDSAFVYAHRADPEALLIYNDYGAEDMGTKSNGVYNLVKRMKENKIPIHGVGLQSHFSGSSIRKADIDRNIKRLGDLGLRVAITELDIVDASHSTQPWKDLMDVCMANANCTTFITWGVYDAQSWRANGGTCNCLIYDTQMKAKAIHGVLLASMANADPAIAARRLVYGKETSKVRIAPRMITVREGRMGPWNANMPLLTIDGEGRMDIRGRRIAERPFLIQP